MISQAAKTCHISVRWLIQNKCLLTLSVVILKLWRNIYYKTFSKLIHFGFIFKPAILINLTCFIATLKFPEHSLHPLAAAVELLYKY